MSNEWFDTIVAARRDATSRIVVLDLVRPDEGELMPGGMLV